MDDVFIPKSRQSMEQIWAILDAIQSALDLSPEATRLEKESYRLFIVDEHSRSWYETYNYPPTHLVAIKELWEKNGHFVAILKDHGVLQYNEKIGRDTPNGSLDTLVMLREFAKWHEAYEAIIHGARPVENQDNIAEEEYITDPELQSNFTATKDGIAHKEVPTLQNRSKGNLFLIHALMNNKCIKKEGKINPGLPLTTAHLARVAEVEPGTAYKYLDVLDRSLRSSPHASMIELIKTQTKRGKLFQIVCKD